MGIYIYLSESQKDQKDTVYLKNYLKINDCTYPKFIKRHKCRDSRRSVILRGDKPKKVHIQIHHTFGLLKSKFKEKSLRQHESLSGEQ